MALVVAPKPKNQKKKRRKKRKRETPAVMHHVEIVIHFILRESYIHLFVPTPSQTTLPALAL
jgi:hypothetical protein